MQPTQPTEAYVVDGFEKSGKETEALKFRQGADVIHSLEKWPLIKPLKNV